MATLSHHEVIDIREDCGDTFRPPMLGYLEIQRMHDLRGGEHRDVTVVYCLRRILAKRSILVEVDSAIFEQTLKLLEIWLQITGLNGGFLEVGELILKDYSEDLI